MPIENVRYWENTATNLLSAAEGSPLATENRIFDNTLLTLFGRNDAFSGYSMQNNDFFGYDLNSPSQIREASREAKLMGLEDVLAAQLSSPLPILSRRSMEQKSTNSGFNAMINLTVQLQIAKAQKAFDSLSFQKNDPYDCPDK